MTNEGSSNTIPKQLQGKGFKKGDPRINRKGRPRSFDALRALALEIASEKAGKGAEKLGIELKASEKKMSTIEYIMRGWAFGCREEQQKFVEHAYGKVPDKVDMKSDEQKTITIKYV